MKKQIFRVAALVCGSMLMVAGLTAPDASAKSTKKSQPQRRDVYAFPTNTDVKRLEPFSTTVYTTDGRQVSNLSNVMLTDVSKDSIVDFRMNPAGNSFVIIVKKRKPKKPNEMFVYGTQEVDKELGKFDVKKYGVPTAACFANDARTLYVAAGGKLYSIETKKYKEVKQVCDLPFAPESMLMSPNGYFMALVCGDEVAVLNCDNNTVRATVKPGAEISDVVFAPDNSDMAVLTADGLLTIYDTRTFDMRKMVDNLGEARGCDYNFDGKYMAVVTAPNNVALVNLLRDSDREYFNNEKGGTTDVCFFADSEQGTLMGYPEKGEIICRRMYNLKPYYNKLIADEASRRMDQWLKMMPGETMEDYRTRVSEENRRRQRQLFEDEIATGFAGDMLGGAKMSLGSYDRANGVLAVNFENMPTLYFGVPEADVTTFTSADSLRLSDVQYGVLPDDTFEPVFARLTNLATGKTYVYDNHNRTPMNYMNPDDAISIELLQQQQMEEVKLQELREKIVAEAKKLNVISDHTHITVDSRMVPEYDASGKKILNYNVTFTYNVEPEFSGVEDFGPGKYHVEESGAATSMLKLVKEAFEGDLRQYIAPGKKVRVALLGTADATPIIRPITYDGSFGEIENEPVYRNGQLGTMNVASGPSVKENDQLAFLRGYGVKEWLGKNVAGYDSMNHDYRYDVEVNEEKGSEFRRITVDFTFVDAF